MADISSQLVAIFEKQASDSRIDFTISLESPVDSSNQPLEDAVSEAKWSGRSQMGRVKDMVLWGDQHRILQVLINLVSNSLKFTPPGGKIAVAVRCTGEDAEVKPQSRNTSSQSRSSRLRGANRSRAAPRAHSGSDSSEPSSKAAESPPPTSKPEKSPYAHVLIDERTASPPPGRMIMFEFQVEDTGPGIPEHSQERIFEPFIQGDLGLARKYGGTGLGLSICSQLAKLMRGTIGLKSEIGTGSTFTMRIPLRYISSRGDSTAGSLPGDSRKNSLDLDEARHTSRRDPLSSLALQSSHSGRATPNSGELSSQPRLVGLSQPFFTSDPPPQTPISSIATNGLAGAEATKRRDRVKVLIADDNFINQEVVLRLLKLENHSFDVTLAKGKCWQARANPFRRLTAPQMAKKLWTW